jgi:predicted  nucleic acid-binding Zn-ribbon protein
MNPDLERLIALQRIDSSIYDHQRRLAEEPERNTALDARVEEGRLKVAAARERLTGSQTSRREIEKEVAVHQTRLSKFRDQLMSVKTNVEYQAMQKEIEFAQHEVKGFEDRILELMLEADDLTAAVKGAELELVSVEKAVEADRRALRTEMDSLKAAAERTSQERTTVMAQIEPRVLSIFELVSRRRNGVAVAEARGGICTICHVRLRPQVFNEVRRNDQIIQCDSCNRILYYVPTPAAPEPAGQPTQ